jgi:hypothetical protein
MNDSMSTTCSLQFLANDLSNYGLGSTTTSLVTKLHREHDKGLASPSNPQMSSSREISIHCQACDSWTIWVGSIRRTRYLCVRYLCI